MRSFISHACFLSVACVPSETFLASFFPFLDIFIVFPLIPFVLFWMVVACEGIPLANPSDPDPGDKQTDSPIAFSKHAFSSIRQFR